MKTRLLITLLGMASCLVQGHAQDSFRDSFDSFRKKAHKEFADFRQKANAEYAEFVKKAWKTFEAEPVVWTPIDEEVPPVVIEEEKKEEPIEDQPVVIEEEITIPTPTPQPEPVAPIEPQPEPVNPEQQMAFAIYGTQMSVRARDNLRFTLGSVSEKSIASAWTKLAGAEYNNLIIDCLQLRENHNLCDWAYIRMLDTMAQNFLGKDTNEAELLKAFIYCQSGYQMRLALVGGRLHMLYASRYAIFDKQCWIIDGVRFYGDNIQANLANICEAAFPKEQSMDIAITSEPKLAEDLASERTLVGRKEGVKASVKVNRNLISLYDGYPTGYYNDNFITRWALYAETPMSSSVKESLYPQLRILIKEKSNAEAVNILCHWVQTAFVYELDNKLWGGDRAFFADETLYYPYCDCEDRSILLTRLVRDLLGLKCALVYYPGHLATAIAVGEDVKGDYFRIDGRKFLVCDPTYIGAPIGVTMEGMENETAKVIVLE